MKLNFCKFNFIPISRYQVLMVSFRHSKILVVKK